jgi:hypothetical protein
VEVISTFSDPARAVDELSKCRFEFVHSGMAMTPGGYEENLSRFEVAFNAIFIRNAAKMAKQLYRPREASIGGRDLTDLIEKALIFFLRKLDLHLFIIDPESSKISTRETTESCYALLYRKLPSRKSQMGTCCSVFQ